MTMAVEDMPNAEADKGRAFPGHLNKEDQVRGQQGRSHQHLRRAQSEEQAAHGPDLLGAHFQTDGEQKQHHAELRDLLQLVPLSDGNRSGGVRPDNDPGDDEAQHRPKAQPLEQDDANGRRPEEDDDSEKNGWEVHGDVSPVSLSNPSESFFLFQPL